jgi:hypothetical protein
MHDDEPVMFINMVVGRLMRRNHLPMNDGTTISSGDVVQ